MFLHLGSEILYTALNSPSLIFILLGAETDSPRLEFAHSQVLLHNPYYISYGIYETCVFYISPRQRLRNIKQHNFFHEFSMKWKFISDPIFITV